MEAESGFCCFQQEGIPWGWDRLGRLLVSEKAGWERGSRPPQTQVQAEGPCREGCGCDSRVIG